MDSGGQLFSVSLVDSQGNIRLERLWGANEDDVTRQAQAGGDIVVRCEKLSSHAGGSAVFNRLRATFSKSTGVDTVTFSQDMATLIDAGVTVKEAISVLAKKESSPSRIEIFRKVDAAIETGVSFSNALTQSGAFPELLVATVAASEETGDLATGLSRYAKHQQNLRSVRDKVVGACVYPMLLLTVGSMVVALLLGLVIPRFATLIDSTGKELPFLSKVLMNWGHFVDANAWVPFALIGAFFSAIGWVYASLKSPEKRKDLLTKLPGISKVVREFQHLQMYRTTAILTARGIAIHKALVYSLEFLDAQDQDRLKSALSEIRQGQRVSDALAKTGLADVVATSMISVAEKTGSMPEMMDRVADFYERTLSRNIDIVSRLIEPVLMIIFGAVIGGIVVLMYLPIFDLASSIT